MRNMTIIDEEEEEEEAATEAAMAAVMAAEEAAAEVTVILRIPEQAVEARDSAAVGILDFSAGVKDVFEKRTSNGEVSSRQTASLQNKKEKFKPTCQMP